MRILVAVFTGLAVGGAVPSGVTNADDNVLETEVADLRAEIERLSILSGEDWLTQERADEIRGLVQDVLADADTRASLLQSGVSGGWDKHPFIESTDGSFRLELQGQLQVRFVHNNRDNSADDDNRWGFENRRTKLKFAGYVVDPNWKYKITGAFSRSTGSFGLEDAYIARVLDNGWTLKFGQFKGPWMREELVSSSKQLAVERSLVNEEFNQGFQQGVQAAYNGEQFGFAAMVHDGLRASNGAWSNEDTEFAASVRVDFLAAGNWNQFGDFTSFPGSEFGALIGAAVTYEQDEYGSAAGPEEERYGFTLDCGLEFDGANLYGAFVYFSRGDDLTESRDQYAFVIQGGLFLNDDWEGFLRYEYGDFDTDGVEDLSAITVGVNRYWSKHNLKWTTDLGFGLDEVAVGWATAGAGWQADSPGQDRQVVLRTQLQLLF